MKLAFVSDFYFPSIGGTQILAQQISEGFHDLDYEIEIFTSEDNNRKKEEFPYQINEFKKLNFINSGDLLKRGCDTIFVLADLFSPTLAAIDPSQFSNSLLILNLDENVYGWIAEGKVGDLTPILKKIKSYKNVVSFCQGAPVNKFLDENKIGYHFIPNFSRDCMKTDSVDFDVREILKAGDKKIIFNHGNFEDRKNQLYLAKKLSETSLFEDHIMVFLGNPRTRNDVKYLLKINNFIEKNNLSRSIKIVKGTNNKKIIDSLLKASDIYVMPSKAEGLPLVLLEAMSAGLPWISTPVGGVPDVFGDLSGGIVLDNIIFTSSEIEEAVRSVSEKNTSREEWEREFTKEVAISRYRKIVEQE